MLKFLSYWGRDSKQRLRRSTFSLFFLSLRSLIQFVASLPPLTISLEYNFTSTKGRNFELYRIKAVKGLQVYFGLFLTNDKALQSHFFNLTVQLPFFILSDKNFFSFLHVERTPSRSSLDPTVLNLGVNS